MKRPDHSDGRGAHRARRLGALEENGASVTSTGADCCFGGRGHGHAGNRPQGGPARRHGLEVGVRYAERRLAGLDETGNRGSAPKYTTDATRRILRVLDLRPPDGYGRLSERLSLTINVRSLDWAVDRQGARRCRSPPSRAQAFSRSGAGSERTRSTLARAKIGAKATILISPRRAEGALPARRPPRWLACIWRRPRTPS